MIGKAHLLKQKKFDHPKLQKLDLSCLIQEVSAQTNITVDTKSIRENLDSGLLDRVSKAIEYKDPVFVQVPISNQNRAVGAMLSHEITKKYGASGLPEDTIRIKFKGSAGESFGAFTCAGVTLELEGDANNYVGKGFSGGKMIIYPPKYSDFLPQENIIIGNVAFYGATSGKCFIRGMAAERFCVRNSGVKAVVEGVGDHACEYMTGGTVVILGSVGKNFGAGMSGGVCYVWDCKRTFKYLANDATYDISPLTTHQDQVILRSMIEEHVNLTGSTLGKKILLSFESYVKKFFKVIPREYAKYLKRVNKSHQIIDIRNWYQWSPRDVAQWLRQTNGGIFMKFSDRFINNKIGGPALLKMSPLAIRMMVGINSERICREIYFEIYQLRNQDQKEFIPKLTDMVCYFHFRSRKWLIGRVTDIGNQGYRVAFDTFDKWVRRVDVFPTAKMPRALSTNKMHELHPSGSLTDFPDPTKLKKSVSGSKFMSLHHVSPGLRAETPKVLAAFDDPELEASFREKMKRDPGATSKTPSMLTGRVPRNTSNVRTADMTKMPDIEDIAPKAFHMTIAGKMVEDRPTEIENPVKLRGFLNYSRKPHGYRNAEERMNDWEEIGEKHHDHKLLKTQGARCMDCGVPFCNDAKLGCPLGNRIPEFNDLVHKGDWKQALDRLLATNNFPEFTGRICPAPCEGSCVLGLIDDPVTIKSIECAIIDKGFEEGWIVPCPPPVRSGKNVAIIGSGPAGLAAGDLLNKMGHSVTIYERDDRAGGLLMYGVPNMKLDKEKVVNRRLHILEKEGINFVCNADIGRDMQLSEIIESQDAVFLSTGSTTPRDLPLPGRNLKGIMFAMDFLRPNTRSLLDSRHGDGKFINAKDLRVIVIGGGDTGNDCIGTCMRHGCKSLVNFEMLPEKAAARKLDNPWPLWPQIHRVDYGHEEVATRDGEDPRLFSLLSLEFVGNEEGHVTGVKTVRIRWTKAPNGRWQNEHIEGTEKTYEADLILLACGFVGPELYTIGDLEVELDRRKNYSAKLGENGHRTNIEKLFAAGDCRRGQSLVVHALAEGRHAAREMDRFLMGESPLL